MSPAPETAVKVGPCCWTWFLSGSFGSALFSAGWIRGCWSNTPTSQPGRGTIRTLLDRFLFGCFCRTAEIANKSLLSSACALACYVSSDWWVFLTFDLKVWLILLSRGGAGVSACVSTAEIKCFYSNLGFITLKNTIHLSLPRFGYDCSPLSQQHTLYFLKIYLSFFSITRATLVAARKWWNTDCNWMKCKAPGRTWAGWEDCEPGARQSLP